MKITSLYPVIMSHDVAASAAFWTAHFPLTVTFDSPWYVSLKTTQAACFEMAFLDPQHPSVPADFRGKVSNGLIINLEVEDVDDEYQRLCQAGLPMLVNLRTEDFGQRHFITVDPNGVLIDVIAPVLPSTEFAHNYTAQALAELGK